jgi:hypothetical protein
LTPTAATISPEDVQVKGQTNAPFNEDGEVIYEGGNEKFFSLDGISFRAK